MPIGQGSSLPTPHEFVQVEDDETPEMIMAKFEALERIQSSMPKQEEGDGLKDSSTVGRALDLMTQADQTSRDGCLTDAQLLEVFKQVWTCIFFTCLLHII